MSGQLSVEKDIDMEIASKSPTAFVTLNHTVVFCYSKDRGLRKRFSVIYSTKAYLCIGTQAVKIWNREVTCAKNHEDACAGTHNAQTHTTMQTRV